MTVLMQHANWLPARPNTANTQNQTIYGMVNQAGYQQTYAIRGAAEKTQSNRGVN